MQVRIRNRSAESWGYGLTRPVVQTITTGDTCPICGGPRGEARNLNQSDDGEFYSVDVWDNPCGHIDRYADLVAALPSRLLV